MLSLYIYSHCWHASFLPPLLNLGRSDSISYKTFQEYRGGGEEQVPNSFETDINKNPHGSTLCFLDCSLNVAMVGT